MIRKTFRKSIKVGKSGRAMVVGGIGRKGPYVYVGVRHEPSGVSAGTSVGTEGRNVYGGIKRGPVQARLKYNVETRHMSPRIRLHKRKFR